MAAALRCEVLRNRIIRDLATEIVESYEWLRRAENRAPHTAKDKLHERPRRKDAGAARAKPCRVLP